MKRVLIITYYWPPAGGIGVQRWLRFSNYLPSNGWTPVVFTALNASYPIIDQNLLTQVPENIEVHRVRVPEPNRIISFFQKKSKGNNQLYKLQQQSDVDKSILKKILWNIRGNFFIPDARMLWQRPACNYLKDYLSKNTVDAIISTGPPHTAHLIGLRLKQELGIPWIADFRDPWTSMDYLQKMNLSNFAKEKHKRFEKSVLLNASHVVVVGKTIQKEFKDNYNVKSEIIYNGFSKSEVNNSPVEPDKKFTIAHIGSFLHNRNCDDLWECLSELTKNNSDFANDLEIKLVGNIAPVVLESIEKFGLTPFLSKTDQVDHITATIMQRSAQVLLLPIDRIHNAEFVLSGKLFEYLQAKRPILLIGPPKGDAANVVRECSAGEICNFNDMFALNKAVLGFYEKYKNNENDCKSVNIERFAYENLTKQLTDLLETIV